MSPFRLHPLSLPGKLEFPSPAARRRYQALAERCPAWASRAPEAEVVERLGEISLPPEEEAMGRGNLRLQRVLGIRAALEAQADGSGWTPLLDALAQAGFWSEERPLRWEEERWVPLRPAPDAHLFQRGPVDLGGWIARQQESQALEVLLQFRYRGVRALLACYTQAWSERLLESVLAEGGHGRELMMNFSLPEDLAQRAITWAEEALESRPFSEAECQDPLLHPAVEVLQLFPSRGRGKVSSGLQERLLSRLSRATGEEPQGTRREPLLQAIPWILVEPGMLRSPEQLHRLYEGMEKGTVLAERLVRHEAGNGALALRILQDSPGMETVEALVVTHTPWARELPEIRRQLMTSTRPSVLEPLLGLLQGADFRQTFCRLLEVDGSAAVRALSRAEEEAKRSLRPEDLLPLLQEEKSEHRLRAISLLGQLHFAGPEVAETEATRSGRADRTACRP